jgi:sodium/proline symporter
VNPLIISFLIYLVLVVIVGVVTSRKMTSQSEFFLGGQSLPGWVITISERASGESAWLLLGLTGAAVTVGLGEIWTVLGCVSGILFLWFFIAARLRREFGKYDALTLPEFLGQKYKDQKILRLLSSIIIIFFFSFYVSAQMVGAGKILTKTGIVTENWQMILGPITLTPTSWGIIVGAVIVVFYTLLGGFRAVVWTDLMQGFIMLLALVVLPVLGAMELWEHGGSMNAAIAAEGIEKASLFAGKSFWPALSLVLGGLAWGLGYMGQPHLLVRFMALSTAEEVKKLRWLAGGWTVLAYGGAFMIGVLGLALYGSGEFIQDPERIMPALAMNLLPAWLAGIIISGAVAAMMSTADSQLLVVTSAFSEDLTTRIFKKKLSQKQQVLLSRMVTLGIGFLAFLLAVSSQDTVYAMVSFAWSGLGASFGPVMLLMFLWPRLNKQGVIACLITGSLATIFWKLSFLDGYLSHRLAAWILASCVAVAATVYYEKN